MDPVIRRGDKCGVWGDKCRRGDKCRSGDKCRRGDKLREWGDKCGKWGGKRGDGYANVEIVMLFSILSPRRMTGSTNCQCSF